MISDGERWNFHFDIGKSASVWGEANTIWAFASQPLQSSINFTQGVTLLYFGPCLP
jgi:hypothetical protein